MPNCRSRSSFFASLWIQVGQTVVAWIFLLALSITPAGAAATLVADYRFEESLKSSVPGVPDLVLEGASSAPFAPVTNLFGSDHLALDLVGSSGLRLDTAGKVASNAYTAVLLFAPHTTAGYGVLFDPKDGPATQGWFTQNGVVIFNPGNAGGAAVLEPEKFIQLTLVKSGGVVRAYADGVRQFELVDGDNRAEIGANGVVHFLRQADGSYAVGGRVARIRLYNGAMSDAEVAALVPVVPASVPLPSGASVVADYRFEGSLKSSVAGAPELAIEGANNFSFLPDLVLGTNRTVLDMAAGGGLRVDATGLLSSTVLLTIDL